VIRTPREFDRMVEAHMAGRDTTLAEAWAGLVQRAGPADDWRDQVEEHDRLAWALAGWLCEHAERKVVA
jgi:hypothetical protein